jgi:hypothetical protein
MSMMDTCLKMVARDRFTLLALLSRDSPIDQEFQIVLFIAYFRLLHLCEQRLFCASSKALTNHARLQLEYFIGSCCLVSKFLILLYRYDSNCRFIFMNKVIFRIKKSCCRVGRVGPQYSSINLFHSPSQELSNIQYQYYLQISRESFD